MLADFVNRARWRELPAEPALNVLSNQNASDLKAKPRGGRGMEAEHRRLCGAREDGAAPCSGCGLPSPLGAKTSTWRSN